MNSASTIFEYQYRDAGNYKSCGRLRLLGSATEEDLNAIRCVLDSGVWFVAEELGIPTLYGELFALSNGRTPDDHTFHEFLDLRPSLAEENELPIFSSVSILVDAFRNIEAKANLASKCPRD